MSCDIACTVPEHSGSKSVLQIHFSGDAVHADDSRDDIPVGGYPSLYLCVCVSLSDYYFHGHLYLLTIYILTSCPFSINYKVPP